MSEQTRDEYLEWAKKRALAYLEGPSPNIREALTSMMSDVSQHSEMTNHKGIEICIVLMLSGGLSTVPEARRFIEGYH